MDRERPDQHRLRYARQIALSDWGEAGQQRLSGARALIVGLGGLGSPVASYLAGAGVGHLTLNDFDRVDLSNLHRQPLHTTQDIKRLKTESAADKLRAINPDVSLELLSERLTSGSLKDVIGRHTIVIDASDNFATRFAVNAACFAARVPLVSAAAIRFEGQLAAFSFRFPESPCYACLYDERDDQLEDCQGQGVAGPVTGVIGSMAAIEALKLMLDLGQPDECVLHCYNARRASWRRLTIRKRAGCAVCS